MINMSVTGKLGGMAEIFNATEQQVRIANEFTARDVSDRSLDLFEATVADWDHKVEFFSFVTHKVEGSTVSTGTKDKPFFFVDEGTSVRRALLSRDWQSKTTPGSLQSGPGRGRVVAISKKFNFPGITARDFSGQVAKIIDNQLEPMFFANFRKLR